MSVGIATNPAIAWRGHRVREDMSTRYLNRFLLRVRQ